MKWGICLWASIIFFNLALIFPKLTDAWNIAYYSLGLEILIKLDQIFTRVSK